MSGRLDVSVLSCSKSLQSLWSTAHESSSAVKMISERRKLLLRNWCVCCWLQMNNDEIFLGNYNQFRLKNTCLFLFIDYTNNFLICAKKHAFEYVNELLFCINFPLWFISIWMTTTEKKNTLTIIIFILSPLNWANLLCLEESLSLMYKTLLRLSYSIWIFSYKLMSLWFFFFYFKELNR